MPQSYLNIFERFVPQAAAPYALKLYNHFGFEFKIKKSRQTKLGDYRFDPKSKKHTISINNDLNPYAFLITYLHEVAHLITYEKFGSAVNPHGNQWKENFKKVAAPILNEEVFPEKLLMIFNKYLVNPKASSCSDPHLLEVLKQFDFPNDKILLKHLTPGDDFTFNQKEFKYISKRRTRYVCLEMSSGKKYLISQLAEVKKNSGG